MTNPNHALVIFAVIALGVLLLLAMKTGIINTSAEAAHPDIAQPQSASAKIENAMSAAPIAISRDATIMDWPASQDAAPVELRAGTNGWTCFPDEPTTPVNDPMCADSVFLSMLQALMSREPFSTTEVGFSYMLKGGGAASNSDPFLLEPAPGEQWLIDPPHVMLIGPELAMANITSEHRHGGPYMMFKGTPYQHVMMPVNP